jgi:hypothetical protein
MIPDAEYYRLSDGEKMFKIKIVVGSCTIVYRDIYADFKKNPKCNLVTIARYLGYTKCLDGKNNSQTLKIIYKKLYKRRKVNKKHKLKRRKNKVNSRRKRRKN